MKTISDILGLRSDKNYIDTTCPFCGSSRFIVQPRRNFFFCNGCGFHGDVSNLVQKMYNMTYAESLVFIDAPSKSAYKSTHTVVTRVTTPSIEWQQQVGRGVVMCERILATTQSKMNYLTTVRGLTVETIRNAKLGYARNDIQFTINGSSESKIHRGITIPRYNLAGQLVNVNCRCEYTQLQLDWWREKNKKNPNKKPPKYKGVTGYGVSMYSAGNVRYSANLVVVEGEFDALLMQQFVPSNWCVITMGASGYKFSQEEIELIKSKKNVLRCFDNDDAGKEADKTFTQIFSNSSRIELPAGIKDFTELWQAVGTKATQQFIDDLQL